MRSSNELKCSYCGVLGHYPLECPSRRNRSNPRNTPKISNADTLQANNRVTLSGFDEETQGAEEQPAVGKGVRDGSGERSFHLLVSQNAVGCHAVWVDVLRSAPTIQATILGSSKSSLWIQGISFSYSNLVCVQVT
jgi:hypothetical protein